MEDVEDDLLDRTDEGEQAAEGQGRRKRVADRGAAAQDLQGRSGDIGGGQRPARFGGQRLGKPQAAPQSEDQAVEGEADEDMAPAGDRKNALAESGSEHRHDHEYD